MALSSAGFVAVPPGGEPGFDHADVDVSRGRLYVAHTGADRVEVIDTASRTYLRSLPVELPGVAGVLIDGSDDLLFTSDRAAARVSLFRCSSTELLGQVDVGAHPNGLAYDPARRHLYSFNLGEPLGENCTASVVEVDSIQVVDEVALPGRPRWAVHDPERDRIYVNIRDPAVIAAIDCVTSVIERTFVVPCAGPHGLWLHRGRLFCAADGGELVVLDRDSGEVVGSVPLPGLPDVVMLDLESERLYVAIGDPGVVCSIDTERLELEETVDTEAGAHTCCWDPVGRCLYVFSPESSGVLVFEDQV
jgi:DNA-binding beta-propeller fold protein YncE